MNFGKWIIVTFVLFAAFIGTLVAICIRQDISLVSKNYYQDELEFQHQIARVDNANRLSQKPTLVLKRDRRLVIDFNTLNFSDAQLKLVRPSDARLDEVIEVRNCISEKDMSSMAAGYYRARLTWKFEDKEFFMEYDVFVP